MPWKKLPSGDDYEFSGELADWAGRIKKWHAGRETLPLTVGDCFDVAVGVIAGMARKKWEAGWFAKGKLKKLEGMVTFKGEVAEVRPDDAVPVLDFLATELGNSYWHENDQEIDRRITDASYGVLRARGYGLLVDMATEKDSAGRWFWELIRLYRAQYPEVPFDRFAAVVAEYSAELDLAQVTRPDALIVAKLTPLLAKGPDGLIREPLPVLREVAYWNSQEMTKNRNSWVGGLTKRLQASVWAAAVYKWHAQKSRRVELPGTITIVCMFVAPLARQHNVELDSLMTLGRTVGETKFHKPLLEVFDSLARQLPPDFWDKNGEEIIKKLDAMEL